MRYSLRLPGSSFCLRVKRSAQRHGGYAGGNTAEGQNALFSLTTGGYNTAVGFFSLGSNTVGRFNTAIGAGTLLANVGNPSSIDGSENTATGAGALLSNTTGTENTATGAFALLSNSAGFDNTAMGDQALKQNTTGSSNNAFGAFTLSEHTTGDFDNAFGTNALIVDHTGIANNAFGNDALAGNLAGNFNTAMGDAALGSCSSSANTAIGSAAGLDVGNGSFNVYVGVGLNGVAGEVGHTYISNIKSTILSGGGTDTVTIDLNTGLLGHLTSSRRYKEDIKPVADASKELYRLKPVSFRYKKEFDRTQSPAFGLIAEEVGDVNPGLVAHDGNGRPESVHYEMVNAMLLNEFLKEHRKVQEQGATIARLEEQIEALTTGLQQVRAQLAGASPSVANSN